MVCPNSTRQYLPDIDKAIIYFLYTSNRLYTILHRPCISRITGHSAGNVYEE